MKKEEKIKFVEEWTRQIQDARNAILVDFRGLTVAEATALRTRMREADSVYRVVKNNLALRAIPGTPLEGLADHFVGPCAVAYNSHDPVRLAKTLVDFSKESESLKIKIGLVDGQLLEASEIKQLSRLPGKEELLGRLLYLFQYPVRGLATALNNIIRNLAVVLAQVAKAKE